MAARNGGAGHGADDAADDGRIPASDRVTDDCARTGAEYRTGYRITGHRRTREPEGRQADESANQRPVPGFVSINCDCRHADSVCGVGAAESFNAGGA